MLFESLFFLTRLGIFRHGLHFSPTVAGNPGHKACYHGSPATSVRKANFVVKVVVLECCEKTMYLTSYLKLRIL